MKEDIPFMVTDMDGDNTELRTARSDPNILIIEGSDMLCLDEESALQMANAILLWVKTRKFTS